MQLEEEKAEPMLKGVDCFCPSRNNLNNGSSSGQAGTSSPHHTTAKEEGCPVLTLGEPGSIACKH